MAARRRDREPVRAAVQELKVLQHPKRAGRWIITVTPDEVEAVKESRIADLQAQKHPKTDGKWLITVTSKEAQAVIEMRLGRKVDIDFLSGEEPSASAEPSHQATQPSQDRAAIRRAKKRAERLALEAEKRDQRKAIFRENIRRWLAHEKMSQREAAERMGISMRLLQRWAKEGIAQPSKRTHEELDRLGEAMRVSRINDLWVEWFPHGTVKGLMEYLKRTGQMEQALNSLQTILQQNNVESSGDPKLDLESVIDTTFGGRTGTPKAVAAVFKKLGVKGPDGQAS